MTVQWLTDDTAVERLAASVLGDQAYWTVAPWPAPAARVRRAAREQRRRRLAIGASTLATLAVVGAGSVLGRSTHHDQQQVRIGRFLDGEQSRSGLYWLLTPQQWADYTTAHPMPTPSIQRGQSPAPVDDNLRGLEADVQAAIPGSTFTREDSSDGGEVRHAVVWVMNEGIPVVVERRKLAYPIPADGYYGDVTTTDRPTSTEPTELPTGSGIVTVTGGTTGYSTGSRSWSGPWVLVATADGWLTTWTAPTTPEQLRAWAVAADQHEAP